MTPFSSTRTFSEPFVRASEQTLVELSDLFEELLADERLAEAESTTWMHVQYLARVESGELPDDHYAQSTRDTIARERAEVEARYLPAWEVVGRDGDVMEASGHALDVLPSLNVDGAQSLILDIGTYGSSSAKLRLDHRGALIVLKSTPKLVNSFAPRMRQELAMMKPRWARVVPDVPLLPTVAILVVATIAGMIIIGREYTFYVALPGVALLVLAYFIATIPRMRIGPRVAPPWQKGVQWILSHVFAALLGVLFAYWLGPR